MNGYSDRVKGINLYNMYTYIHSFVSIHSTNLFSSNELKCFSLHLKISFHTLYNAHSFSYLRASIMYTRYVILAHHVAMLILEFLLLYNHFSLITVKCEMCDHQTYTWFQRIANAISFSMYSILIYTFTTTTTTNECHCTNIFILNVQV